MLNQSKKLIILPNRAAGELRKYQNAAIMPDSDMKWKARMQEEFTVKLKMIKTSMDVRTKRIAND